MKRKIYAVLALIVILCLNFTTVAFGYTYGVIPEERIVPLVVDDANLLSEAEESMLTTRLSSIGDMYEVEIGIVTVTSLEGKSAQAFADDYYDYNGFGYGDNDDGLIVLYKDGVSGDRELYITTHGTAIYDFSDYTINSILDIMISDIVDSDYYDAFLSFADECEYVFENAESYYGSDDYYGGSIIIDDYYGNSGSSYNPAKERPLQWIAISIAIGFAIAFLIMLGIASSLKTVRRQVNAASYVDNMNLTARSDTFVFRNVRKTPIPKSTSSGGGSSTHRSSSGRSHGGGGRRF